MVALMPVSRRQEGLDDASLPGWAGRTPSSTVEFSALPIPPLTVSLGPLPKRRPPTRWARTSPTFTADRKVWR